jgi:hypothetical protein
VSCRPAFFVAAILGLKPRLACTVPGPGLPACSFVCFKLSIRCPRVCPWLLSKCMTRRAAEALSCLGSLCVCPLVCMLPSPPRHPSHLARASLLPACAPESSNPTLTPPRAVPPLVFPCHLITCHRLMLKHQQQCRLCPSYIFLDLFIIRTSTHFPAPGFCGLKEHRSAAVPPFFGVLARVSSLYYTWRSGARTERGAERGGMPLVHLPQQEEQAAVDAFAAPLAAHA